jgi:hypothetical protein
MSTMCKLNRILPTREGVTLRVGTEVAVTDEISTGLKGVRFRLIFVADARYHVREEDLAYACGEQ